MRFTIIPARPARARGEAAHGVCERANSLLKTTFKALRRVSLDPSRITKIAAAALVLLQLEYDRII